MGFLTRIKERIKVEREERAADREVKDMARSEARQIAREERAKQIKDTALFKEQQRAEQRRANIRERIKAGGFGGQVAQQFGRALSPARPKSQSVRRRRKKTKGKRKVKTRVQYVERRERPPEFPRII